jgi:predicted phosphodiesterase
MAFTLKALATDLAKANPHMPNRTLAKKLKAEVKDAKTLEQCRTAIRDVRGNHGDRRRNKATVPKPNGKAGMKLVMPKSINESWEPLEVTDAGTWGIIGDLHVPYHSELAIEKAFEHFESRDVDGIVLNGDIADFYTISRHQKDPRKRNLLNELDTIRDMLEYIRARFPKQRIIYRMGNHEERWQHWIWAQTPELAGAPEMELATWLHFAEHELEYLGDKRPLMMGDLPLFHGHELPSGISSPVNPARGAYTKTGSTVAVNHHHRTSSHSEPDMWHSETFTWSIGCLCLLNPMFARVNKWNWGFAVVTIKKDRSFDFENLRINKHGTIRRG